MLKFEGKFKVGDIIKAYDFEPRGGVDESFILGEILEEKSNDHGFAAYKVNIIKHVLGDNEELKADRNTEAWIPHQVQICEFDERIQKIA